jgi:dTDP-4-amino-4,6-dideoxygalactose transaminase
LRNIDGIRWMRTQAGSDHIPFRFALLSNRRDAVVDALEREGVQTRSFFYPLHLQPALTNYARGPLPVAEALYSEGICLPVHTGLKPPDIDSISEIIASVHKQ